MSKIIICAKVSYNDGDGEKTVGLTDQPFFGDASGLEGGLWQPLIADESDVTWTEQARHAIQDQVGPMSVGELSLVNTGGFFDGWIDYDVAGYKTEIRRANSDSMDWSDMERVLVANNSGIRFMGRSQFTIELESSLSRLSGPIDTDTWEEGEPENKTLEGKARRLILGQVFQLKPDEYDPSELVYYVSDNFDSINTVAEGGNPTDTAVDHPLGFRLLQSPILTVTCDAVGPPAAGTSEDDLLESIGSFDTFDSSGDPDGWDVYTVSGKSSISETSDGNIDVSATGAGDTNTGDKAPTSATSTGIGLAWESSSSDDIVDVIDTDTGDYAIGTAGNPIASQYLDIRTIPGVPPDANITGIEVDLVVEGAQNAMLGRVELIKNNVPISPSIFNRRISTKETITIGGDGELFGYNWTYEDVRSGRFGVRVQIAADDASSGAPDGIGWLHQVIFKIYYSEAVNTARMYAPSVSMTPGSRYRIRFYHVQDEQSINARFSGVAASGDEIAETSSSFSEFRKKLSGSGVTSADFVPDESILGIEFFRGTNSTGQMEISQIELVEVASGKTTYAELVPYILEQAGLAGKYDADLIDRHDDNAGSPKLGWIVGDESADDLLALLAMSLRGYIWHGLDGTIKSNFLALPEGEGKYLIDSDGKEVFDSNNDQILTAFDETPFTVGEERIVGEIETFDDLAPNITDQAVGAKNWHPIDEDRAAGITNTWTEEDRARVAADYRVTRRAVVKSILIDSDGDQIIDSNLLELYAR